MALYQFMTSLTPKCSMKTVSYTHLLLEPNGTLAFEDAVAEYGRIVRAGVAAGADLVFFETFTDLYELKAALLAAKVGVIDGDAGYDYSTSAYHPYALLLSTFHHKQRKNSQV